MSAAPVRQQRPIPTGAKASAAAHAASASAKNTAPRPSLRAVAAPEQARSLAPLAWTLIAVVLAALAAVLLINTQMSQGAYERRDLKIEIADLHQQQAALVSQLEANASPQLLATAAAELGMVPAEAMGFVSVTDAAVLEHGGKSE